MAVEVVELVSGQGALIPMREVVVVSLQGGFETGKVWLGKVGRGCRRSREYGGSSGGAVWGWGARKVEKEGGFCQSWAGWRGGGEEGEVGL